MRIFIATVAFILLLLLSYYSYGNSPTGSVRALACAPSNPNVVAALIEQTVWITMDRGRSWRETKLNNVLGGLGFDDPSDTSFTQPSFESTSIISVDPQDDSNFDSSFFEQAQSSAVEQNIENNDTVIMAVSDVGSFALWTQGSLLQGDYSDAPQELIGFSLISGLVFDKSGRLWIAGNDMLWVLNKGVTKKTWAIRGIRELVTARSSNLLTALARDGIWSWDTSLENPEPLLILGGRSEAVAAGKGGWYVSSGGRLSQIDTRGDVKDLGLISMGFKTLVANHEKIIWAKNADNIWHQLRGGSWRRTEINCVCADAVGKIWIGTSLGLVGPQNNRYRYELGENSSALNTYSRYVIAKYAQNPGPPKCRNVSFNPLPSASLTAGMGRGQYVNTKKPDAVIQKGARTWAYIGLKLSWFFKPIDFTACIAASERYRKQEAVRLRRVQHLFLAWQGAAAAAQNAINPKIIINAVNTEKKLRELLCEISGIDPRKEKN